MRGVPTRRRMGVVFECVHDDLAQLGDLSMAMSAAEIEAARSQQQGVTLTLTLTLLRG